MTGSRIIPAFAGLIAALGMAASPAAFAQSTPAVQPSPSAQPAPSSTPAPTSAPAPISSPPAPAPSTPTGPLGNIGYFNASQLSQRCAKTDPSSSAYCFAYLAAVTDTARAYEIWLGAREFCPPAGMSQSEVRKAFLGYVSAYPSQAAGQAASVIINALKQSYPCD